METAGNAEGERRTAPNEAAATPPIDNMDRNTPRVVDWGNLTSA
jgi:hypothetical protein